MKMLSRSVGALVVGLSLGLMGCQEDNESSAAKQQAATGEVPKVAPVKSQADLYKQNMDQMKNMPGYNATKAKKATEASEPK